MTLESMLRTVNKGLVTSALCATLFLIPAKGYAQESPVNPGKVPPISSEQYLIRPYDLSEIISESEFLTERYGAETTDAILDGLVYNRASFIELAATAERLLGNYLKTGDEKKDFGKFDAEVIYGMIRARGAGASNIDSMIQNAYALEARFARSPDFQPEEYSRGIAAILEAIGHRTGEEASSVVDRYFSYKGPLDRNDMIKATSLSRTPEEVIEFGERLHFEAVDIFDSDDSVRIVRASYGFNPLDTPSRTPIATVRVYSKEDVSAMMYAYGLGNMGQEDIVSRMRELSGKYDKDLARDVLVATAFGKKSVSELEFTADIMSDRYGKEITGKIIKIYANTENVNLDSLYLCSAPVERKPLI